MYLSRVSNYVFVESLVKADLNFRCYKTTYIVRAGAFQVIKYIDYLLYTHIYIYISILYKSVAHDALVIA